MSWLASLKEEWLSENILPSQAIFQEVELALQDFDGAKDDLFGREGACALYREDEESVVLGDSHCSGWQLDLSAVPCALLAE